MESFGAIRLLSLMAASRDYELEGDSHSGSDMSDHCCYVLYLRGIAQSSRSWVQMEPLLSSRAPGLAI